MTGTLQLRIGQPGFTRVMHLDFDHLLVEEVRGGMRLKDRKTGQVALVWDDEITAAVKAGNGATPLSAFIVCQLLQQKFLPAN